MNSISVVLLVLSLLIIKHFICDFVLQTNKMIFQKGLYGARGGLYHAAEHAIGTTVVLCFFFYSVWPAVLLGLVDGFLHYHIDWVKQYYSSHYKSDNKQYWVWLGADQMCHYITYVFIVWIAVSI
jgi:hypothetical protein